MDMMDPKMAMYMSLLQAGAAASDPRGTYGSGGAAINNALRAGMGTYLPLMQWQQQRADKKDEKDYRKNRDKIMDRFRKDTQSFQAAQLELSQFNADSSRMNAESMVSIRDLQRQQLAREIEKDKMMQEMISQYMPTPNKLSEVRAADTGMGPLKSKVPQQFGPRAEPQQPGMIEMSNLSQYNPNPIAGMQQQANTAAASIPQSVPPPPPQMSGYDMMNVGGYLDLPGMEQQGKDMAGMNVFLAKEAAKMGMKAGDLDTIPNPLGLETIVINKKTKQPVGMIKMSGSQPVFVPVNGPVNAGPGNVIDAKDYFK